MTEGAAVAGVVMAGGLSRRMGGGDKGLRLLAGRSILERVIERARPQVGPLVLNANGDPARFETFGLPVAADVVEGFAGPLAGILTGLDWVSRNAPDCAWLASFACDAPFLPRDLVRRMLDAVSKQGAELTCAASQGRAHPVFDLWPLALKDDLARFLGEEGGRKVDIWTGRYRLATVDFEAVATDAGPLDPFFNANRPEDLAAAERFAAALA